MVAVTDRATSAGETLQLQKEILQMCAATAAMALILAVCWLLLPEYFDMAVTSFLEQSIITQVGLVMLYLGVGSMVIDGIITLLSTSEVEKLEQEVDL